MCGCASGSPSGSIYAVVCNVLLLGGFAGNDTRRLVICGGEELRPDHCAPSDLADSAGNVRVLWELPDSVRCVPDPDPLSAGTASRLPRYRLTTRGAGWRSDLP